MGASPEEAVPPRRRRVLVALPILVLAAVAVGVVLVLARGGDPQPRARLFAAGDVGTGGEEEYRTAEAMDAVEADREYDALLLLGDNVYESGDPAEADETVLEPFAGVLDGPTELVVALGNHDVAERDGTELLAALGQPGRWFTRDVGPVRVVVVDSNDPSEPEQLTGSAARSRRRPTRPGPW